MKDEFDIPTGDIVRDYEMLTCETFLDFYDNSEPDLSRLEEECSKKEVEE